MVDWMFILWCYCFTEQAWLLAAQNRQKDQAFVFAQIPQSVQSNQSCPCKRKDVLVNTLWRTCGCINALKNVLSFLLFLTDSTQAVDDLCHMNDQFVNRPSRCTKSINYTFIEMFSCLFHFRTPKFPSTRSRLGCRAINCLVSYLTVLWLDWTCPTVTWHKEVWKKSGRNTHQWKRPQRIHLSLSQTVG